MALQDVDLHEIAGEIFAAMLQFELVAAHAPILPDGDRSTVTGCVHVTGDWEGAVTFECSELLARRAAATMFALPLDDVSDAEVVDTVGELANMVGGNVKSLLSGECGLSLPSVSGGSDHRMTIPGALPIDRVAATCDGQPVVVTLLERVSSSAPVAASELSKEPT